MLCLNFYLKISTHTHDAWYKVGRFLYETISPHVYSSFICGGHQVLATQWLYICPSTEVLSRCLGRTLWQAPPIGKESRQSNFVGFWVRTLSTSCYYSFIFIET